MLVMQVLQAISEVVSFMLAKCTGDCELIGKWIQDKFAMKSAWVLGVDKEHLGRIEKLQKVSQLFFDDLIFIILQVSLFFGWLDCPEVTE